MQSIKVFPLVFTLLVFLSSYLTATVYEDAEDGNTAGWRVYDSDPAGAQILNVYDNDKGSNVIQLQGDLTNNGYILGGWEGSADAWGDSSSTTITWSMKYNESYNVYIRVMTTNGARYIYYTPSDTSNGGTDEYVHLGLGTSTRNGTWLTFTRDLQADLAQFQPGNTITQINAFLVRGSGFLDDIEVGGAPIAPCTTQTPDNLVSNPCVEQSPTGWSAYGSTEGGWVANEGYSGTHSLKITNLSSQNSGWRYTDIPINNARTITFGGWSKAENVNAGALYALDFYVKFADGTDRWFAPQEIHFSTGTHDWEHKELTYTFDKDVVLVRPYLLLYYDTGTVWYDDIYVIPQTPSVPLAANAGPDQVIASGTDLVLDGSASTGTITSYAWDENGVAKGSTATLTLSGLSSGTHTFRLTVTDNSGDTATDTVTIRVNAAPIANAGPDQNITLGDSVTLNGSGSTDDFGIVSYVWSESTIPINVSGVSPAVLISNAGTYTVTLTVTDSDGESSTDTVVIRVNTPPSAEDMNLSTTMNTPITFALTATDADNDTNLTFPIETGPSHGTLSGPEDNLTYTPNLDFTGTDTFTYKAYDGTSYSELSTVTIEVYPPAMAVHDDYNTTYMTPLSGNVLDNDLGHNITLVDWNTTRDANLTQLCNITEDNNVSLDISSDGAFLYHPEDRFAGNTGFYYTIQDDLNNTSTTSVCITVYPPRNDLSITKTAPVQVDGGAPIDYTLTIQSATGEQYVPALDVVVIDRLPLGVIYNGVTAPSGWTCGAPNGEVTCTASPILPGYTDTITIHAFAPNSLTTLTNTAEIDSATPDPDRTNNSSSATTNIQGVDADLAITKTVSASTINKTQAFDYTLRVVNQGSAPTDTVIVRDDLDSALGFITINGGTDWNCGQSNPIICTYIANNGVFPPNSTSSDIVISVRAPATEGNISNTATVTSSVLEANPNNNSDDINVTIQGDPIPIPTIPLTKYAQFNLHGDYTLIGNANINWDGTTVRAGAANPPAYNDQANMVYQGFNNSNGIYNSSASTINIDSNYTIKWAGLYWEGHYCSSSQTDGTLTGAGTGCDWSRSPYANFDAVNNNRTNTIRTVQFQTPAGTTSTIRGNTLNVTPNSRVTNDFTYSAFADVTSLVQAGGNGTYTVSNIVLTEGMVSNGGNYGGWALVVVYEDPQGLLNYKNISIFNGFQYITADNTAFNISGFLTPRSGPVSASLGFFTADGDPTIGGVIRMQDRSGTLTALSNSANPAGNMLNSTMTNFGNNINAGVTTTYGVDADRLNVSSFMNNSQTSTSFSFDVTGGIDPQTGRTLQDYYTISMFTFATDLTAPIIDNFIKRGAIIDRNGNRRDAGPNEPIYPGSQLEYTITFTNTGDEVAEGVEIFDDFDYDGLSNALNVNTFDATKLKLFNSNTTDNEVNNPDCGYLVNERRVYCKIPSMAIDETYTMQFVVSVKEQFDTSTIDANATNTAYAKYRNPNDNSYVKRGTTPPPESEAIGGKSNALTSGIFKPRTDSSSDFISINAINQGFSWSTDRNITTKLANTDFNITLVHIDRNGDNTGYEAHSPTRPLNVVISIDGNGTSKPINDPAKAVFTQGDNEIIATNLRIPNATRGTRLKMGYLDWKQILGWATANSSCLVEGQNTVYFNGLPTCFNVYVYAEDLFPRAEFPQIATCYGEGNITIPAGSTYACDSRAYNLRGEPTQSIFPSVYQHNFGCFQCITEGYLYFRKSSVDDFAVKPVAFDINSQNPSFPDLLRAGVDYNVSIIARDGQGNPTQDYNTSISTFRTGSVPTRYLRDGDVDTNGDLEGNFTISTSGSEDLNMSNGISTTDNNLATPEDIVTINYSNVGKIDLNITDPNWCLVDADDTPAECNATRNANNAPIETGRSICSDDANATFIPHHFKITAILHNHRDDSNVTYLSNDLNMSAHIGAKIEAMNAKEQVTTNFKKDFYENPITLDFNVTDWNTTLVANLPFDRNGTDRPDVDIKRHGIIKTPAYLGFGENNDSNGTRTIAIKDTNTTQRLMFNYKRDTTTPKNPFTINGQEVNLTVDSTYTTTMNAPEDSADINGTGLASGKASFYYGNIRPDSKYYKGVKTKTQSTPMFIDIYCDSNSLTPKGCKDRGIDTNNTGYNGNHEEWWLSIQHTMSQNDGNVTLGITSEPTKGSLNKTTMNTSNAKDGNITVTNDVNMTNKILPNIVEVSTDPDSTSSWLLDVNNTLTEVEFINDGNTTGSANSMWTGHGNTGNVVDDTSNRGTNNRLGW